jgi:hypothetical protein
VHGRKHGNLTCKVYGRVVKISFLRRKRECCCKGNVRMFDKLPSTDELTDTTALIRAFEKGSM